MKQGITIIIAALLIAGCGGGSQGRSSVTSSTLSGVESDSAIPGTATVTETNSGSGNAVVTGVRTYHNPEPSSMILLSLGLTGLVALRAAKSRKNKTD